jgi:hypothetical protein
MRVLKVEDARGCCLHGGVLLYTVRFDPHGGEQQIRNRCGTWQYKHHIIVYVKIVSRLRRGRLLVFLVVEVRGAEKRGSEVRSTVR